MTYTREQLISICEQAIVPEADWFNRDTAGAQASAGKCWAWLRAGCEFEIQTAGDLATDERTIWLYVYPHGFMSVEIGRDEGRDADGELFYLPTEQRLAEANGKDWY